MANPPQAISLLYARTVIQHAQKTHEHSLFPGQNYKGLADFLSKSTGQLARTGASLRHRADDTKTFLTLHHYGPSNPLKVTNYERGPAGQALFTERDGLAAGCAQLVFLRGFATPEWLNLIGSGFRVDPEFFRRHLSFLQAFDQFDQPSLPCLSTGFVKLPLVTIGTRGGNRLGDIEHLNHERQDANVKVSMYLRQLGKSESGGLPIVREVSVHDDECYTVEQEVSITIRSKSSGGWAAIVWLDVGQYDLESRLRDWLQSPRQGALLQNAFVPIYQYREKMAMKGDEPIPGGESTTEQTPAQENSQNSRTPYSTSSAQSAMLLHRLYGQTLIPAILKVDAFYALSELFAFSAFSENQFLNLITSLVDKEQDPPMDKMQASLLNLQYWKTTLEAHMQKQQAAISCISSRGAPKWPRATDDEHVKVIEETAQRLLQDYNHLLMRAQTLRAHCVDLTALLMNKAMLEHAQHGINQADGLTRLTLLAFFFVPLSFTTSFFGMNFVQLQGADGPTLGIWVWFIVSVPLFMASGAFLFWGSMVRWSKNVSQWLGIAPM